MPESGSAVPRVTSRRSPDATDTGTVVAWLVADGTHVSCGDEIVEVESDKARMAYPAAASGVLRIAVPDGAVAAPGSEIARIDVDDGAPVVVTLPDQDGSASTTGGVPRPEAALASPSGTDAIGTVDMVDAPGLRLRDPSRIERLVAERMVQSRREIPTFAVAAEIDMSAALAMRSDLKRVGGKRPPSVNDLIVKACALALRDHPRVNGAWIDGRIAEPERVNVGVAVATDDDQLVVPVVRDADLLSLGALAARTRDLTHRARNRQLVPDELRGGTFTVSNLGMLGVAHFDAIVAPGQGAILAVGSIAMRFVPVDGQPVARPLLTATLSSDHRVIYGAHAAAFLDRLRTYLEHPGSLAL